MANTTSAQKQARQNKKRHEKNIQRETAIKTGIKKVLFAIDEKYDEEKLQNLLKDVAAKLSRAKSKHALHPNTAARKMSRLAKKVAQVTKKPATV